MSFSLEITAALAASFLAILLRATVQGSIALALVWVLVHVWPAMPARLRPWLWRLACLKLALGLLSLPGVPVPLLPSAPAPDWHGSLPYSSASVPIAREKEPPAPSPSKVGPAIVSRPGPAVPQKQTATSIPLILAGSWLVLVTIASLRAVVSWCRVAAIRRGSRPLADPAARELLAALCVRMGLRRVPDLRGAAITTPLLTGLLRPVILLPQNVIETRSSQELAAIFGHELAHIRRGDLFWGWLYLLNSVLFCFNPLVWLTRREWLLAQEIACDAEVVRFIDLPAADYARLLVSIAASRDPGRLPALGVMDAYRTLERRVTMLAYVRKPKRLQVFLAGLLLALTALLCLIPWTVTAQAADGAVKPPLKKSLSSERVNLTADKSTMDRVLRDLFETRPFNYLYADDEPVIEVSAHFSNLPMNTTLDTLGKNGAYQWKVRNNIICAWQEINTDGIDRRKYSGRVRLAPLTDALQALGELHPFRYRIEDGSNPQVVEANFRQVEFPNAFALLLAHCDPPMKSRHVGDTLILRVDDLRPRPKKTGVEPAAIIVEGPLPAAPAAAPVGPARYNYGAQGSFDSILEFLFHMAGKPYRIAPTVTATDEEIAINPEGKQKTLEELLSEVLAAVPGQKTPLTYSVKDGIYVIEPKNTLASDSDITFPSLPGEKAARKDYLLVTRPLGEILREILDQTGEEYVMVLPDVHKAIAMHVRNATVPQALDTALRLAAVEPHLRVVQQRGRYCIEPFTFIPSDANLKDCKFSGRFNKASAWEAFALVCTPLANYTIDNNLHDLVLTATFQDRTLDQAFTDMAHGASAAVDIKRSKGILWINAK